MKEAEMNAEADRKAQDKAELKNKADHLAHGVEKTLRDNADKVDEADKNRIEDKVRALREAVASDDEDRIGEAFRELEAESHQLAEKLYAAGTEQPQAEGEPVGAAAGTGGGSNDDVIDADFSDSK